MISIVVSPGGGLTDLIYRALTGRRRVLCITEDGIQSPEGDPEILLLSSPAPLNCQGDVIYVIGAQPEKISFSSGTRAVAVIPSRNAGGLAFAVEHHLKTLTCGLANSDTITLSSLTEEDAVICLQRGIAPLSGGALEPSEIPVRLGSPVERYDLLSLAAVLLLCGEAGRLAEPL